ncbi:NAC domain-containing protein 2-like [Abrus precatorius]|uniref:NAC domain-containing protein 2-like n=1 Tax=Abrus precatorius TaxID=3816 RepID=A0A8B8M8E7_ABRPR|nr:NAC domain-containing protein 2-like [Abrus precatorius]
MASNFRSRKDFKPTDDELIRLFLYNKVHGKPLPSDATILEYDLYGDKNPWEIWEAFAGSNSYSGKDLYFFTTHKKKFQNGSRLVRTIGKGSWEGEDVGKEVVASDTNQRIGIKKRFRFEKSGTHHDGAWIMHEYSLDSSLSSDTSANNYVLCRFRKNLRHNVGVKRGRGRTKTEEINVTNQRRTVVLALPAPLQSDNKSTVLLRKDNYQEPRNQPHNGDQQNQTRESTTKTEFEDNKDEDGDINMSWPELFSLQLRNFKGCLIQEEEIPMIPNTFYMDLMSENIRSK